MFKITGSKGFHIMFPNGVTLSTQFGGGNYGDNYDMNIGRESDHRVLVSHAVEVAAWKRDGTWITNQIPGHDSDEVLGYIGIEEWLLIFDWCKNWKETPNE